MRTKLLYPLARSLQSELSWPSSLLSCHFPLTLYALVVLNTVAFPTLSWERFSLIFYEAMPYSLFKFPYGLLLCHLFFYCYDIHHTVLSPLLWCLLSLPHWELWEAFLIPGAREKRNQYLLNEWKLWLWPMPQMRDSGATAVVLHDLEVRHVGPGILLLNTSPAHCF